MLSHHKLAVTTGSMNRLKNLLRALPTWLALPEPDHIVVVDWSSTSPLHDVLLQFNDPRLIVVDAPNQPRWHHSKCHNLELQIAARLGCEIILRLDNDYLLSPIFFKQHPLPAGTFYAVDCHRIPPEIADKKNLCGTLFARTQDVLQVGGYNERLVHYGYEDEDLYHRLCTSGLKWQNCDLSTLDHIPHDDRSRFENLAIDTQKFHDLNELKNFLITKNRMSSVRKPWTIADRPTDWQIDTNSQGHWHCIERKDER